MTQARKKKINIWMIITATVTLLGGGGFATIDRVNAGIDKRISTCPQVQKIDTLYRQFENNSDEHEQIIKAIKELDGMIREMNRGNPRFTAYYRIKPELPEMVGPRRRGQQ